MLFTKLACLIILIQSLVSSNADARFLRNIDCNWFMLWPDYSAWQLSIVRNISNRLQLITNSPLTSILLSSLSSRTLSISFSLYLQYRRPNLLFPLMIIWSLSILATRPCTFEVRVLNGFDAHDHTLAWDGCKWHPMTLTPVSAWIAFWSIVMLL